MFTSLFRKYNTRLRALFVVHQDCILRWIRKVRLKDGYLPQSTVIRNLATRMDMAELNLLFRRPESSTGMQTGSKEQESEAASGGIPRRYSNESARFKHVKIEAPAASATLNPSCRKWQGRGLDCELMDRSPTSSESASDTDEDLVTYQRR